MRRNSGGAFVASSATEHSLPRAVSSFQRTSSFSFVVVEHGRIRPRSRTAAARGRYVGPSRATIAMLECAFFHKLPENPSNRQEKKGMSTSDRESRTPKTPRKLTTTKTTTAITGEAPVRKRAAKKTASDAPHSTSVTEAARAGAAALSSMTASRATETAV